jgi:serine/threonine protein kinase
MGQVFGDLSDTYHVQKVKLGQGSFGQVWRAIDKGTSEIVAIKQFDKHKHGPGRRRHDFRHEVDIMQKVSHENILKFIGMYEDDEHVSLVLEYCDGGDFSDKLKVRPEQPTGPCGSVVAGWLRQICSAIGALHAAHIVHRDVNPKNFLLSRGVLKLADLGIAQLLPTPGTKLFTKCGTPGFMAPEQYMLPSGEGYSLPVDMWAAGIVLYMMLHGGRHPYMEDGKLNKKGMVQRSNKPKAWNAKTIHGIVAPPGQQEKARTQTAGSKSSDSISTSAEAASEEELLDHLLAPDPDMRASAYEVLQHPWLSSVSSRTEADY